jgi:hypothetical protein
MTTAKSFNELLIEGALTAVRTLSLSELYQQIIYLEELNLPEDVMVFPLMILNQVIVEKLKQRAVN